MAKQSRIHSLQRPSYSRQGRAYLLSSRYSSSSSIPPTYTATNRDKTNDQMVQGTSITRDLFGQVPSLRYISRRLALLPPSMLHPRQITSRISYFHSFRLTNSYSTFLQDTDKPGEPEAILATK